MNISEKLLLTGLFLPIIIIWALFEPPRWVDKRNWNTVLPMIFIFICLLIWLPL